MQPPDMINPNASAGSAHRRAFWASVLVLVALVLAIYGRSIYYNFIDWDDLDLVLHNTMLNPPSWDGVWSVWAHPRVQVWTGKYGEPNPYTPVAYTVWAFVAWLTQMKSPKVDGTTLTAGPFHAVNVILHAACVAAVFAMLYQITRALLARSREPESRSRIEKRCIIPSLLGAAVFALHPIQVEAATWISGMNNLMAGLFSLLCIAAYVRSTRPGRERFWYAASLVLLVISLLSKPTAVVTPAVLLVMDWLVLGRPFRRAVLSVAWMFALTVPFVILGRLLEPGQGIFVPAFTDRPAIVMDTIAFYLRQIVWPRALAIDYGRTPQVVLAQGVQLSTILTLAVAVALMGVFWWRKQIWAIGAMALFGAAILPVSGIVPFGFQVYSTVADRYAYLPMIGVAVLVTLTLAKLPDRFTRPAWLATAVLAAVLGVFTVLQNGYWRDSSQIALRTLQRSPRSLLAYNILGFTARQEGRLDDAENWFNQGLAIDPNDGIINLNMASLMSQRHRLPESLIHYRRALAQGVGDAKALYSLGVVCMKQGLAPEAEGALRMALKLDPKHASAMATLGYALAAQDKLAEADEAFRAALKMRPNFSIAIAGLKTLEDLKKPPAK
ncbi:hypothetical protein BH10PLA1_BH10PLA1_07720 [soil metagenome]